jgi:hypothetical protein
VSAPGRVRDLFPQQVGERLRHPEVIVRIVQAQTGTRRYVITVSLRVHLPSPVLRSAHWTPSGLTGPHQNLPARFSVQPSESTSQRVQHSLFRIGAQQPTTAPTLPLGARRPTSALPLRFPDLLRHRPAPAIVHSGSRTSSHPHRPPAFLRTPQSSRRSSITQNCRQQRRRSLPRARSGCPSGTRARVRRLGPMGRGTAKRSRPLSGLLRDQEPFCEPILLVTPVLSRGLEEARFHETSSRSAAGPLPSARTRAKPPRMCNRGRWRPPGRFHGTPGGRTLSPEAARTSILARALEEAARRRGGKGRLLSLRAGRFGCWFERRSECLT